MESGCTGCTGSYFVAMRQSSLRDKQMHKGGEGIDGKSVAPQDVLGKFTVRDCVCFVQS